jgi:hypothetical protein
VCLQGEKDVWTVEIDVDGGDNTSAPLVEFVLTNGTGDWDKAPEGKNYVVTQSGVHALHNGRLSPTTGKRLMLVTDLDDTLINEDDAVMPCFSLLSQYTPALARCCHQRRSLGISCPYLCLPMFMLTPCCKQSCSLLLSVVALLHPVLGVCGLEWCLKVCSMQTLAFRDFWTHGPALAESTLVFNTGRDIEKVKTLMVEKEYCMPIPDIVICSVGTQVASRPKFVDALSSLTDIAG